MADSEPRIDMDNILTTALAQKEALLCRYPKLRSLQEEIDKELSPDQSLADRLFVMGAVFKIRKTLN